MSFAKTLAEALMPRWAFRRISAMYKEIGVLRAIASTYGQHRSMASGMCLDAKGDPLPWYTYPAMEYLASLDLRRMSVFEYGSGNSSRWWAKRCARLVSVESDPVWYQTIGSTLKAPNFEYRLVEPSNYASAIAEKRCRFDVVVVDGIQRADCAIAAIANIRSFGGHMLILDNSDWYPALVPYIRAELGWLQVDFHGFGPINRYSWTTSLFIDPQSVNDLVLSTPPRSLAAVANVATDDLK